LSEKKTWYEQDLIKNLMSLLGGKSVRGMMANFITGRIYGGKMALSSLNSHLETNLNKSERKILIIVDSFTNNFTGLITRGFDKIEDMEYKIWDGAEPEVPLNTISDGVKICEEFKPKVLIAIGGGSVIDTAKLILMKYEKPEQDFYMLLPFGSLGLRNKIKYFVAIPTTSGTGSEVTQAAVATDIERDPPKKLEVMSNEIVPDIVVLDTDFVKDMPPFLTMATGLDVFAHSMGSYVSNWGSPLIDALNITAIKEVLKYLPRAYKYGKKDLEAREHMQMAALIAGLGFGNSVAGIDHSLGHSFGKIFNVHHGFSVGLFTVYSIAFQAKITNRWIDLCPIFGIEIINKERSDLLKQLCQSIKSFIHSIDGATCVKDINHPTISEEDYFNKIEMMADYAYQDALTLTSFRPINFEIYQKIFEYAWDGRDIDF
jgi:alcohol dehydrogenase class IV